MELERKNKRVISIAEPLLEANCVCLVDIITAEVLRGVRSRNDFLNLQSAFANFPTFSSAWVEVAELAWKVARRGFMPPLVDLYIAYTAISNNLSLLTQDRHFLSIKSVQHFRCRVI